MNGPAIFERVRELGGPTARPEAEAVLRSALGALGAQLAAADRQSLRDTVPEGLRSAIDEPLRAAVPTPEALGIALAHACGMAPRHGLEQLEIACLAIAERMPPDMRESLGRHLPGALGRLLTPPPSPSPTAPKPAHAHSARGHTLASGKPGSKHGLSGE